MKPPSFQFYADDFVAGTADMTQQEVGAYILLLSHQWSRGEIPSDPARAALIAKGDVSSHVMAKFPDGKNERLERVRVLQDEWRDKSARAGRKSADLRNQTSTKPQPNLNQQPNQTSTKPQPNLNQQPNQTSTKPQPTAQPNANSPVSSLQSPVSIDKDNANDSRPDGSGPAAAETVAPVAKRTATAPQTDADWLDGLKTNAAYQGIDVAREHAKAQVWCENNRRVLTRPRFINWLNRAERPMAGRSTMR